MNDETIFCDECGKEIIIQVAVDGLCPLCHERMENDPDHINVEYAIEDDSLLVEYDEALTDDSDDFRDAALSMNAEW